MEPTQVMVTEETRGQDKTRHNERREERRGAISHSEG